jgi:hypothetical protein
MFNLALLLGVGFWSMNLVGHSQPARGRWQVPTPCSGSGGSSALRGHQFTLPPLPLNFESSKQRIRGSRSFVCCRECALVSLFPGATKSALKRMLANAGEAFG